MVKQRVENVVNEWSHFIRVEDLGDKPYKLTITPDDRQKVDLARRLDVVSVESATADIVASHSKGGVIHVTGRLQAHILQNCVITLEPLHTYIDEEIEGWFSDQEQMVSFAKVKKDQQTKRAHAEVEVLPESEDPELVINGQIDLGELATQHLSLAIDPYAHKEGVAHEFTEDKVKAEKSSEIRRNPFEALKDWKEKR
jgi:hypothetical protein